MISELQVQDPACCSTIAEIIPIGGKEGCARDSVSPDSRCSSEPCVCLPPHGSQLFPRAMFAPRTSGTQSPGQTEPSAALHRRVRNEQRPAAVTRGSTKTLGRSGVRRCWRVLREEWANLLDVLIGSIMCWVENGQCGGTEVHVGRG